MKKLKLSLIFTLMSAFAFALYAQGSAPCPAAPAGSAVARHGRLNVSGNFIVDQHGEPVQLRGMSFFWNTPGWGGDRFYTAGAVNTLADDWRANVVRVAVSPRQTNSDGFITVINAAIAKGIYVVIDYHTHDHNDRSNAQAFFTRMSGLYRGCPNVIYEIFNEPCPVGGYGTSTESTCNGDNWAQHIRPYSEAVVTTIRNLNDNAVTVVGTRDYSKHVSDPAGDASWLTFARQRGNLVYAVHYYTAEPGTWHQQDLRNECQIALNANLALLVTEAGVTIADGGRNSQVIDTVEANRWFSFLDRSSTGWMKWSIMGGGQASAALTSNANNDGSNWSSNLSPSGTFLRNKLRHYGDPQRQNNVLTVTIEGQGTVRRVKSPGDTVNIAASTTHRYGLHVHLLPVPAAGWEFAGWSGNGSGASRRELDMYGNRNVTATFIQGGNLIKNGSFLGNTSVDWTVTNQAQSTGAIVSPVTNNELTLNFTGANIGSATGAPFLNQRNIALTAGRRYRLSFDARAAQTRNISVTVCDGASRTTRFLTAPGSANASTLSLTQTMQPFWAEFDVGQNVANGQLEFWFGGQNINWFITNIRLSEVGPASGATVTSWNNVSVLQNAPAASKTAWSVVRTGAGLQLSGPAVSGGTRVFLYDVRGRLVTSAPVKSGQVLTLNSTAAPAGNYLLVVRNVSSGKEVYKTRVSLVN